MKKRKLVTTLFTLVCVGILANESVSFAESGEQTERTLDTEEAYESESEETEEESQGSLGEDSQSAELSDSQSLAGTKELYSLKSNEWLEQSGTHRGKHHDKQDIGLILKKGSRIRVRQTNKNFNEQVTMELLADGKKSEQSVTIDSSWQTVKTEDDVAVFFETPTDKKKATIEYTEEVFHLPRYILLSPFFYDWDKTEANVALIKSAKMQMLVPITAKEAVRNLKDFSSIEDLINHSDEVLSFADENLGLDNSTEYNQTTENKYFIKEDKDTTADGYYGNQYTVANERTFEDFWLRSSSWEQNAEIINGYQPNYTSIGTPTADSSNQLYNIRYLKKYEGIAAVEDSYLFTNGNKEQTDNELATQLNAGVHYSDLSTESHSALLLLAMVDQKAGEDALKNLNQSHRSSYFDHTYERINLQDRLIQSYGNTAQLDFGPAIQRWNVPIDKELAKETRMNYRPVAHLDHVVPQDRQAEVMAQFNEKELLSSRFQVVDNDDIAFLGLKGQATLHFSDELLKKLKGKTVSLKDGDKVVASETVSENTVVFNDIPNGVYTIDSSVDLADCDTNYVYVKENENEVTISGEQIDTFDLLGLSDSSSGELIVDTGEQKCLTFRKNTSAPHNYFKNEKYYSVSVYRDKKEIYSKIVNGNDESAFSDTVDLQKEDVIAINHAESKKTLANNR